MRKLVILGFFFVLLCSCGHYAENQLVKPISPKGAKFVYCDKNYNLHYVELTNDTGDYQDQLLFNREIKARFPFIISEESIGFVSRQTNSLWFADLSTEEIRQILPQNHFINYYPNQIDSFYNNQIICCHWNQENNCWQIKIYDLITGQLEIINESVNMPNSPVFCNATTIIFHRQGQGIIEFNLAEKTEKPLSQREGFLFLIDQASFLYNFDNQIFDLNTDLKLADGTMAKKVPEHNNLFLFKNQEELFYYALASQQNFPVISSEMIEVRYFDANSSGEIIVSDENNNIYWTNLNGNIPLRIVRGDTPAILPRKRNL